MTQTADDRRCRIVRAALGLPTNRCACGSSVTVARTEVPHPHFPDIPDIQIVRRTVRCDATGRILD